MVREREEAVPFARVLDDGRSVTYILNLRQNPVVAYATAIGAVGVATALRYALSGYMLEGAAFVTYYPAILIAATVGGFWPGAVATLLSLVAAWYLFIPPAFSFVLGAQEAVSLLLFAFAAAIVLVLVSMLHGALDRLFRAKERQELLTRELHHRSQNLFAVIQTLAMRTLKESESLAQASENLNGRLMALSRAHTMLAKGTWEGAPLAEIIGQELSGFSRQFSLSGCDIVISTLAAQNFALIIHELATNATKYGALSSPNGRVAIEGHTQPNGRGQFQFRWKEMDGPPVITPTRTGFGSTILLKVATQLGENAKMDYEPDGLVYELRFDLSAITIAGEKEVARHMLGLVRK
jgi:two-component sensor histidine kinase